MGDPPHSSSFLQKVFTGDNPLILDAEFLKNHTKVLLRSDVLDGVWKVKLDGDRLSDGWEEFAGKHKFKDGDVLDFKHVGDEVFHVSVASRSVSGHTLNTSSSSEDTYEEDDDDGGGENEADEDSDYETEKASEKKSKKLEAGSSSDNICFITANVTPYSLLKDRLDLSTNFTRMFGEHQKTCEIDVVNEKGSRSTMKLAKNLSNGRYYIRQGWESFCSSNELSEGDSCKFKLVQNEERPMLRLCLRESGNDRRKKRTFGEVSKGMEKKKTASPILRIEYTPTRDRNRQLNLPVWFLRENGIKQDSGVILLNQDGRKWLSNIRGAGRGGSKWFYLRKGWREMCDANGVKVNDSFELELMWEGSKPVFKFCSKIENKEIGQERTSKRRASETVPQPRNVEKTPEVGSCSVSEQVANVKQGIIDTLNTVKKCRTDLETSEQNLEASLQAIDALGERISGISQILGNNLV